MKSPASATATILSGALLVRAAQAPTWPFAAVQTGLASLTLLDFRPTARTQLASAHAALAAASASENTDFPAAVKWAALVRAKVIGEMAGLTLALRAPCVGACLLLLSHLLFWACGAASARVDATGAPSPLPPELAKIIATADGVVLGFAALGAFGPTRGAQRLGATLFCVAATALSVESLAKSTRTRSSPPSPPPNENGEVGSVEGGASSSSSSSSSGGSSSGGSSSSSGSSSGSTSSSSTSSSSSITSSTTAINSSIRRGAPPSMAATAPPPASVPSVPSVVPARHHQLWSEQWWPLCFAAHTSRTAPSSITLLGAPLALWWDSVGEAWRCTLDRCPHRLAPLSEGRIADDGRCLECPYHGWAFEGATGECVRVPQQEARLADGATARARSASRAAVLALPTLEVDGIVWAWAGGLFDGAAAAPPTDDTGPATVEPIGRDGVAHSDYSRDLHMDWSTLCENVMDPAHLPFTHHKTISSRAKAAPITFGKLEGFSAAGFTAPRQTPATGRLTFRAPHLVLAETHRGAASYSDWNVVYAVPTGPGQCRLLVRVVFEVSKLPIPLKWILTYAFTRQPIWWTHLTTHKILEDDNFFLHAQGHTYRNGHGSVLAPDWARRVYLPTNSDAMVAAFRRWIDAYTSGRGAPWSKYYLPGAGGDGAAAPLRQASKAAVLERYDSHVAHCSACSGALVAARRLQHIAEGGVAAALLAAGVFARARAVALVLAAVGFVVARACVGLDELMRLGKYPPPRNV